MGTRFLQKSVFVGLVVLLLAAGAGAQPTNDTVGQRSMAFEPGLGEAGQERVPGGRLVAMAYGFALLAIGGYVAFIARNAAKNDYRWSSLIVGSVKSTPFQMRRAEP